MAIFSTNVSNEQANQEWLASLPPDAREAYMRVRDFRNMETNLNNDTLGSASLSVLRNQAREMGYSPQALREAEQFLQTNYPEVVQYASTHGQSSGGLGSQGDLLVASVAVPALAAYLGPAAAGEAGTGTATAGTGAAAGTATAGTGAAAGTATAGTGAAAGTTSTAGSGGLMSSLAGSGGSNIPAWLGLFGNLYAANQMGGNQGAAADPFAAERPMYQQMLRELMQDPSSFLDSPFFQAQLETGVSAIDRSAAGRGLLGSGRRLTELETFGSNLAQGSLLQYMQQLGGFAGATSGSPATAAQINADANMNQTNAYMQALRSASPLLTQFGGWAMGGSNGSTSSGGSGGGTSGPSYYDWNPDYSLGG